jgi:hypothetical protein
LTLETIPLFRLKFLCSFKYCWTTNVLYVDVSTFSDVEESLRGWLVFVWLY